MTTLQNINSVDLNTDVTNVKNYFNNFFTEFSTISADKNSAILGYFEKYTGGNKLAAQSLASAVIYTSLAQRVDPMDTLTQFTKLPLGEVNAYIAMFLNLNRIGTSYLGINTDPQVNKYVSRTIRP